MSRKSTMAGGKGKAVQVSLPASTYERLAALSQLCSGLPIAAIVEAMVETTKPKDVVDAIRGRFDRLAKDLGDGSMTLEGTTSAAAPTAAPKHPPAVPPAGQQKDRRQTAGGARPVAAGQPPRVAAGAPGRAS